MLILGLLLGLSQAQTTHTVNFVFDKNDAIGNGNKWVWSKTETVDFAANDKADITYTFTNIVGTNNAGETVTLTDHYVMEISYEDENGSSLDSELRVAGAYGTCTDKDDCDITQHECDFNRNGGTSVAQNGATAQKVKIQVTIEGGDPDNWCNFLNSLSEGLADWARTVLIITIVTLVLCVLCIVLVCCGVVKCCCMQQQPNNVVIEQAKY